MLQSPTIMGWLGHALSFQQIAMNEDAMDTTAASVIMPQKAFLVYTKMCLLGWLKEVCENKGEKIQLIIGVLTWQRETYSSNQATWQKENKK